MYFSPTTQLKSINNIFDRFIYAYTLEDILESYKYLCELIKLEPNRLPIFYPKLKSNITSWKAKALWKKFDQRAKCEFYEKGEICSKTKVLIVGGGPCGLRTAIECQLLGAKVVRNSFY